MSRKYYCTKRLIEITERFHECEECRASGQTGYVNIESCWQHNLLDVEKINSNSYKIIKEKGK